jgi:hypothetical protein
VPTSATIRDDPFRTPKLARGDEPKQTQCTNRPGVICRKSPIDIPEHWPTPRMGRDAVPYQVIMS